MPLQLKGYLSKTTLELLCCMELNIGQQGNDDKLKVWAIRDGLIDLEEMTKKEMSPRKSTNGPTKEEIKECCMI